MSSNKNNLRILFSLFFAVLTFSCGSSNPTRGNRNEAEVSNSSGLSPINNSQLTGAEEKKSLTNGNKEPLSVNVGDFDNSNSAVSTPKEFKVINSSSNKSADNEKDKTVLQVESDKKDSEVESTVNALLTTDSQLTITSDILEEISKTVSLSENEDRKENESSSSTINVNLIETVSVKSEYSIEMDTQDRSLSPETVNPEPLPMSPAEDNAIVDLIKEVNPVEKVEISNLIDNTKNTNLTLVTSPKSNPVEAPLTPTLSDKSWSEVVANSSGENSEFEGEDISDNDSNKSPNNSDNSSLASSYVKLSDLSDIQSSPEVDQTVTTSLPSLIQIPEPLLNDIKVKVTENVKKNKKNTPKGKKSKQVKK